MGGGPKKPTADKLVTTCKRCLQGIYKDDVTYWQRQPITGLIHARCATPPATADAVEKLFG